MSDLSSNTANVPATINGTQANVSATSETQNQNQTPAQPSDVVKVEAKIDLKAAAARIRREMDKAKLFVRRGFDAAVEAGRMLAEIRPQVEIERGRGSWRK